MYKILTLNAISPLGLNEFPRDLYEISSDLSHPDAILVRSQNMLDMPIPDSVKVIGRAGAGVNNIPVGDMTKRGIPVFNTPGANANAVRELVIAGMLLASRNICQAWNYVGGLNSNEAELDKKIEQEKKQFVGFELMGKTLGIVGLGSIGVKVANAAISLDMKVIGYDPTITVNRAWELSSEVKQSHSLDDLLIDSDFITFHVPLNEETKNMINASRIHLMKKGVVILNFARDGIIDHNALIDALKEKKIHAYVSDFPSVKLKEFPQVISLPHLGASTKEAEENCAVMIARQTREFLEKGSISFSVNFPSMEVSSISSGSRLAIANSNVPNMVAQISAKIGSAGLNIVSLSNKSREDIAYTVIDVNSDVNENLLKEISQISGVLQVRKINSQRKG